MDETAITVIGAGVVGLAVAAELAARKHAVIVVERNKQFGMETSSRNSEVLHAGLYYPPRSLKSSLCIEGRELLADLAASGCFEAKFIGKLVVAVETSEVPALEGLYANAVRCGVKDIELLDGPAARKLEPAVPSIAALYSPNTGIIDSHALMLHLYAKASRDSALFAMNSTADFLEKKRGCLELGVNDGAYRFRSRIVVNCAGLGAEKIAALAGMDLDRAGYRVHPCKGDYFAYARRLPISRLVYPVPRAAGSVLGVHATLDRQGRIRFGPDAEYTDELSYKIDSGKRRAFFESAKKLLPSVELEHLTPDFAGIRPRLQGPGDGFRDFEINEESGNGLPGLVNLVGIESPGLTASLAIAKRVGDMCNAITD